MGLTDTHFTNPHGLPDDAHYTTAYDLARIAAAAMQNQDFAAIVNCRQKRIVPKKGMPRLLSNHNKLLRLSEDAVGVKTGFTKKSGRCLVGAAEKNGLLLISVTLDAPDDWNDHLSLFRYGFSLCKRRTPYEAGEFAVSLDVAGGQKERVCAVNQYALSLPQVRDEAYRIFVSCNLFVTAPIKAGQVLGSVTIRTARGEETVPLVAAEDVPAPKSGKPFFRLFRRESTEHHDPPEIASGTD